MTTVKGFTHNHLTFLIANVINELEKESVIKTDFDMDDELSLNTLSIMISKLLTQYENEKLIPVIKMELLTAQDGQSNDLPC